VFTAGAEYLSDDVDDRIPAYSYILDQVSRNAGIFLQSDWLVFRGFTLLTGVRADKHNMLDSWVVNPRVSLLYKAGQYIQLRTSFATGFRAPQAFDSDMHFSFAGGGVSRIVLTPGLEPEYSTTMNGSVNFDKPTEKYVYGFTFEGFYTRLRNTFILEEAGSDAFGLIYEKRNAAGSLVMGATAEVRANYNRKIQLEAGFTLQRSIYDHPVAWSDDLEPSGYYLRSPDVYGFGTLTWNPNGRFSGSLTSVYTGPMILLHVAGAPGQGASDRYVTTNPFTGLNLRLAYAFTITSLDTDLEFFAGIKNLLNAYQRDFDTGKYRDSNYIYGPAAPRTYYFGLKFRSI
jgi:outer membrane receptor for ferrienterochelin and colicins